MQTVVLSLYITWTEIVYLPLHEISNYKVIKYCQSQREIVSAREYNTTHVKEICNTETKGKYIHELRRYLFQLH